jgi:hypothetical protein
MGAFVTYIGDEPELIWLTVVKRENISCPTGIQRFLAVG